MSEQDTVWNALNQANLVSGEKPGRVMISTPWYIKTLLAMAGWFAALFLLAFLAATFNQLLESALADLIIGSGLILSAYQLLKKQHTEFIEHLGLALSFAGQALVIFAIIQWNYNDGSLNWLAAFLLNTALIFLMPHFVHRVFSSFFASICLIGVMTEYGFIYLSLPLVMFFCAWCWLNEFRYMRWYRYLTALGYGSLFALLCIETSMFFQSNLFFWSDNLFINQSLLFYCGHILSIAVTIYVTVMIIKNYQPLTDLTSCYILLMVIVFSVLTVFINGVHMAVMIMVLGLASSHRVLIGLGIAYLLFSICQYYYSLETTLLMKSISLMVLGIVIFSLRWCLPRLFGDKYAAA